MDILPSPRGRRCRPRTRGRNPEMEALRFTYMKLRLNTFWLSFGLSIAGFLISLISLTVACFTANG